METPMSAEAPHAEHGLSDAHAAHPAAGPHGAHDGDWKPYAFVFGALLVLTALTVSLSYVDVGKAIGVPQFGRAANIVAGLLVAVLKASLVVWIFMHMNHETPTNRFILFFSLCLLAIAFTALSLDFVWLGTYAQGAARAALGGS
jgi:cytochrome c oxidase subunit 4